MFRALLHSRARKLISEAIFEWHIDIERLSPNTQYYYKWVLAKFAATIPDKPVDKITTTEIRRYIKRASWGKKNNTVNNHVVALRTFGRFLSETYNIPNPALAIKKLKPNLPYQPFISRENYLKVIEAATQRESDLIQLMAHGGFRASEVSSLTWDCLSPQASTITFIGKGSKVRTVPVNKTMLEIISRHSRTERFVNLPKSRRTVYRLCNKAGKRVGVYLAPHMLRRFFASSLIEKGISLLIVSKLLGHASISTTERYLHLDTSYLSGCTDVLD